jgi:hypothetical protein
MKSPIFFCLLLSAPGFVHAAVQTTGSNVKATALVDRAIEDEDGDFPGWIREIVLDSGGSVDLVVVELTAPSRRTIAVPWSYLSIRRDGPVLWRATDEELRRAKTYPSGEFATTLESEGGMVAYAPTEDHVDHFDPAKATTYRGVVVGTMTRSFRGDPEEVLAVIELGDGQTIRARLGPELYLTQIGMGLAPGQSVVLEGFALEGDDDQPLVVVSEIRVQDRNYVLRNLDGTPLWTRNR